MRERQCVIHREGFKLIKEINEGKVEELRINFMCIYEVSSPMSPTVG